MRLQLSYFIISKNILKVSNNESESLISSNDEEFIEKQRSIIEKQKSYYSRKIQLKELIAAFIFMSICIIMMIVEFILNKGWNKGSWWINIDADVLIVLGAKVTSKIQRGEVHRLILPIFLHVGLLHLLLNLIALISLSIYVEHILGSFRYILVYLISGIGGNLMSAIFLVRYIQVGASSSIFGLLSVQYADLIVNWKLIPGRKVYTISLIITSILTLALGILPRVDNFAHLGGFLFGLLTSLIVIPDIHTPEMTIHEEKQRKRRIHIRIIICTVLILILFGISMYLLYGGVDLSFCRVCEYFACLPIYKECKYQL